MTPLINHTPSNRIESKPGIAWFKTSFAQFLCGRSLFGLWLGLICCGSVLAENTVRLNQAISPKNSASLNASFRIYEGVDSITAPLKSIIEPSPATLSQKVPVVSEQQTQIAKLQVKPNLNRVSPINEQEDIKEAAQTVSSDLIHAISNNDKTLIYALLDQGADIHATNSKDSSALMLAAMNQNAPLVKTLIELGAKVNDRNQWGWTALLSAAIKGNLEITNLLLEYGADPNLAGNDGRAPIIAASWNRYPEIIQSLIKANANVNLANRDGWTALSFAAWNGDIDSVMLLLDTAADKSLKTYDRLTPLQLAELRGHTGLYDLLQ